MRGFANSGGQRGIRKLNALVIRQVDDSPVNIRGTNRRLLPLVTIRSRLALDAVESLLQSAHLRL